MHSDKDKVYCTCRNSEIECKLQSSPVSRVPIALPSPDGAIATNFTNDVNEILNGAYQTVDSAARLIVYRKLIGRYWLATAYSEIVMLSRACLHLCATIAPARS